MKKNIEALNGWLYRRIRMCIWKQWKLPKTRKRKLKGLGIPEWVANEGAYSWKAYWRMANSGVVKRALTKERLINWGYYDLATAYQSMHVNYWNRRVPNGKHGGVRGQRLITASYLIESDYEGNFRLSFLCQILLVCFLCLRYNDRAVLDIRRTRSPT